MPSRDEALVALILETMPRLMRELRGNVQTGPEDLSIAQVRALRFVGRNEGASLSALAAHMMLSMPAASKLVQSLVDADLLGRDPSPDDRRQVELRLSAKAEARWRRVREAFRANLGDALAKLTPDERAHLEAGLRGLARVLYEV